ncbi:hypothetical protein FDP41_012845 [Naegleria fowleri]|uniref:GOSR2 n=1 Tax=Naegleria fowleri TaxID=5763 RepID=A0A2P1N6U3_NAEFO|nr:uncharacterized protein FDP41_012845 [Naegleria fowleri]AVP50006.1 GOSR2 [Naegleria fowleri]KAF0981057.1 hypothetical protein FDP41_012845 [Naegleria fowleri]CAG4711775.1 unnamed protein product [Naegleria fowleri]
MRQANGHDAMEKLLRESKNLVLSVQKDLGEAETILLSGQLSKEYNSDDQIHLSNTRTYKRRMSGGKKLTNEETLEEGFSAATSPSENSPFIKLKESLKNNIKILKNYEQTLRDYYINLPRGKSKDKWQMNVSSLSQELHSINISMNNLEKRQNNLENKNKLLDLGDEGYSRRSSSPNEEQVFEEAMAEYGMQNRSLDNSNRLIEQMKSVGIDVASMLVEQRQTMKMVHEKVLGMASTLGISQSTIRTIERRYLRDKYLIYIGMFLITFLLIFVYYYIL